MAPATREALLAAFDQAARLPSMPLTWRAGWRIEPRVGVLEHRWAGPVVAALLLLLPALAAVLAANQFAGWADLLVQRLLLPIVAAVQARLAEGSLLAALLVGDYGLFTMGPLLMVWAAPTVVLYALLLAAYKSSGLVDRINAALHPWVRHVGLAGRDVTRIVMGFGCNVPAVISTRSCSGCSRSTCISGIAFGSACSYQLPATLAVFAAAGSSWLAAPWLAWLLLTTLAYLRLTSPRAARSALNRLLVERRTFLQWPKLRAMWREAAVMLRQFFLQAMPTFVAIACLASLADWCGLLRRTASASAPLMGMFRLPAEAALPVVMASIRKDGILLLAAAGPDGQPAIALSALQLLTATYLAGVLLPCLVTALTITREQSWAFTLRLLSRQVTAAVASTLVLAWGGYLLGW